MHGELKCLANGAHNTSHTDLLEGLVAYSDDSHSDSEEKTKFASTLQSGNTDVRAFFAQPCYGHFPLCWLSFCLG
jgi:hypothetical protein